MFHGASPSRWIPLFLKTLEFRWYVFFFLMLGFWLLARQMGRSGALIRFCLAFVASYLCEWSSSLPDGWFPFGHYTYLPTTVKNELWVGHLPFMDFLSFSFLMVASLGMAAFFWRISLKDALLLPVRRVFPVLLAGGVLFSGIDLVIDPVALRGNRWFLGQIYYYPQGGGYFGVPVANFAGWGFLGLMIMILWRIPLESTVSAKTGRVDGKWTIVDCWGPVFLWLSVYLFNVGVTVFIGEYLLASADIVVFGVLFLILLLLRNAFPVRIRNDSGGSS